MSTKVGLWIDHRKAIIVSITENGEDIQEITSDVEKQPRRSGDSPLKGSYEPVQVPADDSLQRDFTGSLNVYYDKVITSIGSAESILIFGPSTAKDELKERLKENNLDSCIVGIETVDKMTDHQIAAKTRQYFAKS
jgi:microcompartment protein CcmK/EutM